MKLLIVVLLGISCTFGADVWQTNYMPKDGELGSNNNDSLGICYGDTTTWNSYPYAAALRYSSGAACCSGSIISINPAVILTAAHCSGCNGAVQIGCSNPSNCAGAEGISISQWVSNPDYPGSTGFSSDIAVVRLAAPILSSGAQARSIPSVEPTIGNLRVVGYGIDQTGNIPSTLQTANIAIVPRQECQDIMAAALGPGTYVDNTMVCIRGGSAGQEFVSTTCSGDSGGPWSSGDNQGGVTSWGLQGSGTGCNNCNCCSGYPGVGANVAHFAGWINAQLDLWKKEFNSTYSQA